jgi:hypothetical protein
LYTEPSSSVYNEAIADMQGDEAERALSSRRGCQWLIWQSEPHDGGLKWL